jgi:hypothetical protein
MSVYAPVDPPSPTSGIESASLTDAQEEMHKKVVDYLSKDYRLPDCPESDAELMEEEKFWLVSFFYSENFRHRPLIFVLESHECILRCDLCWTMGENKIHRDLDICGLPSGHRSKRPFRG